MSEILDCDPNKGFVAFPVALFDLDLSPGAFRTLAELCRMANAEGQCWPSLAQLGRRLGRSRAAVSGYIAELRSVDVLFTEEQKMANGYNYRLRYTVTFWKKWRAGLGSTRQKSERTVQQVERPLKTKNHNHIKQPVPKSESASKLLSGWKVAVGKAPYPDFSSWPSEALLAETQTAADKQIRPASRVISTDIAAALEQFLHKKGLTGRCPPDMADGLAPLLGSRAALDALLEALDVEWQPHWRKSPNLYQLTRLCRSLPTISDAGTEQKLLKSYLRRWKLYRGRLPSAAFPSKVAA